MVVKPIESFEGVTSKSYSFKMFKSKTYNCTIENGIYYITYKNDIRIPFDKQDFEETFKIVKE